MIDREMAASAAIHWLCLARSEESQAAREESNGRPFGDASSHYARRDTYMRTAEALRREAETGISHCSLCGGAHPNHEHGYPFPSDPCKCGSSACPWCHRGSVMD